jgi:hypothetical protein
VRMLGVAAVGSGSRSVMSLWWSTAWCSACTPALTEPIMGHEPIVGQVPFNTALVAGCRAVRLLPARQHFRLHG